MSDLTSLMSAAPEFFSGGFSEARAKFRAACSAHGLGTSEYLHPLAGPNGETLTTDVALVGPRDATRLLIVISGTHGVEGLAGSGCQVAWLSVCGQADLPPDTAILFIHSINPWGCAWHRRQTEDNVDLNRNFHDFDGTLPANPLYREVHGLILSEDPVSRAASDPNLTTFRSQQGDAALAAALFSGQYDYSSGVGFGGRTPTWSNKTLRSIVDGYAATAKYVTVIDLHTGLGPFGYGTIISTAEPGSAALKRTRGQFGAGVVSIKEDTSLPYDIVGDLLTWIGTSVRGEVTGIALEFGTFELAKLLELQVDDCRRVTFEDTWKPLSGEVRADLVNFFYPATVDWVQSIMLRALQIIYLGIEGLKTRS
jgi:Protein of unknown function (DUF2817)